MLSHTHKTTDILYKPCLFESTIHYKPNKENAMKIIYDIEETAIACKHGEEVTFAITEHNKYSLFKFSYYQLKHKTAKEFNHISYQKDKDLLYYFLRSCAKLSFDNYTLTYDYK